MIVETVDDWYARNRVFWSFVDTWVTIIFTAEIILRILARASSLRSLMKIFIGVFSLGVSSGDVS